MGRRIIVLGILLFAAPAWASVGEDSTWKITVTPDAQAKAQGERPGKDTLIFRGDTFTSTGCVKYGFAPSSYSASGAPETWSWKADQNSIKQGTTQWKGTAKGDAIEGTMVWRHPDGKSLTYTFSGKRKAGWHLGWFNRGNRARAKQSTTQR